MRVLPRHTGLLAAAVALSALAAAAQSGPQRNGTTKDPNDPINAEGYIKPPEAVAKLVAAPRMSNFTWGNPSPTRKWLLHPLTEEPTLEFLGKRHYNLGGWQIDPAANR